MAASFLERRRHQVDDGGRAVCADGAVSFECEAQATITFAVSARCTCGYRYVLEAVSVCSGSVGRLSESSVCRHLVLLLATASCGLQ